MKKRKGNSNLLFALIAITAVAIGIFAQTSFNTTKDIAQAAPELDKIILLPKTKPLRAVNFTDHREQPFGLAQLQKKWSILFFGFTNCPDVCPTTMQTLARIKQDVANAGLWDIYQVIMVSVDPERDSLKRLSQYVPHFDSEFIGIAGTVEDTTEFAKNLGILFFKSNPSENGGYSVDHGASLILINPEGKMAGVISAPHKRDEISQDLLKLAKFINKTPVSTNPIKPVENDADSVASIQTLEATTTNNKLVLENSWIRPAPPTVNSMAAYFNLVNHSNSNITIVNASSPDFEKIVIHDTEIKNGLVSMKYLKTLTVSANSERALAPLQTHLMLMHPKRALTAGDTVDITMLTDDGKQLSYSLDVRDQPVQ